MDMCEYMEKFTQQFLEGKTRFEMNTEVLGVERDIGGQWKVHVQKHSDSCSDTLTFSRIILATGVSLSSLLNPISINHRTLGIQ